MQTNTLHSFIHPQKKEREYISVLAILGTLWLVLWITGCAKKTDTGTSDSTSTATTTTTTAPETTATSTGTVPNGTATNTSMSDANILAALSEADSNEISEAKLVMQKTKDPQVKAFAQMMITDHSKMKKEKADLAKKLNITPQPPANDQEPSALTSELGALNSASSPRAMDSIYVNSAIQDHTQDVAEAKQMQSQASNPQLKNAIGSAIPVIQKHLDHATMLRKKFNGSMATNKNTR